MSTTVEALAAALPSEAGAQVGTYGGECFRAFCRNPGASWYHSKADRYYCDVCAAELNHEAWFQGEPPACIKR